MNRQDAKIAKMSRNAATACLGVLGVLAAALCSGCGKREAAPAPAVAATNGPLRVWASYGGKLESRRVHMIMSQLGGQATLVELAPEGLRVQQGAVLARLDPTRIEREIVKLEGAYAAAKSEYESQKNAEWPLKLGDLERQLAEAQAKDAEERQFLEDNRALLKDDLVTPQEIHQQESRLAQAAAKTKQVEQQIKLSRDYLQPLGLEQSHAKLVAAERELNLARQELQACTVTAPADGVPGYLPTYFGSEFRVARVGDTIFMNLPFMVIPDMSSLVVHCYVPEAELGRIVTGALAQVVPIAFPDMVLTGTVESVGATAQVVAEKPAWQKYFHVVIALQAVDPRLRSGLSVTTHVLAYENPQALLVPRAAVRWQNGAAAVRMRRGAAAETRAVKLGWADDRQFEVLSGLQPGEQIVIEE
jgi:HlyD family secretion protein